MPILYPAARRRVAACLCLAVLLSFAAGATTRPLHEGEGFIATADGPVWYRVIGHGAGTPLLMLHGGPGGNSCGFTPIAERIGAHRPVVLYDQLGTGRSGRPLDLSVQTVARAVNEVDAVRSALGLTHVHLLGHSWGSGLAVAYHASSAAGLDSLVLSGPFFSTRQWIDDAQVLIGQLPAATRDTLRQEEAAGRLHSKAYQDATAVFYAHYMHPGEAPAPPAACAGSSGNDALYEYMWGPTEFRATGILRDFDVTGELAHLDLPVLLTAGRHDEARPETAEQFRARMPHAQLRIFEHSGHSLLEEWQAYADSVEQFLEDVDARRR